MKKIRRIAMAFVMMLFCAPLIHAQYFSKYRTFAFGTSLAGISKQVELDASEVQLIHQQPALIQMLTWYPSQPFGTSRPEEPIESVLFSFYNGALYRMLVNYNISAIKGLTDEDMTRVISEKYGTATRPAAVVNFPTNPSYSASEKVIARWEDSQYSFNLFRSLVSGTFSMVLFEKRLDAQAGISIAESLKLEQQEAPRMEAARLKKETDDLEAERQKNIKTLRP